MALFIRRDKDDKRSTYEVLCDIDADLAKKIGKCTLFCGDVECKQGCMKQKEE
jgi:hypothetical protein